MAKQILTKWIGDDQVIDSKILLRNTEWLRGRNAADTGNLNLIGVNLLDETVSYSDFIPRSGFNSVIDTFIDNEDSSPAASDIYLTESSFFSAQDGFGSTEIATGFMVPFNGEIQTLDMFLDNAVGNGYEYFSNISLGISGGGGLSGIVGMPFVVSSTIDATKVFLRIRNFGGAVGLFTMRILGDAAGEPDETNVIDTVSIAATGVPGSFSDVEFPFASPLNLPPGTYYVSLNAADDDNSALAVEQYGGVQSAFSSGDGGSSWSPYTPIGMEIFAQGAPGDLSVIIYNDNAGEPGSMVGQSDPILRDSILSPGFVTFTFSTPAVVSGSTMYWAALVGDATYQSAESATIIGRRDADQSLYPTKVFTGTWVDPTVMTASLRFSVFGEQQTPVFIDLGKDAAPWDKVYQKESRFMDEDNSNYVGFKAPTTVPSDVVWTLPSTDGSAGQFLKTNGSATLDWASVTSGAFAVLLGSTGSNVNLASAPNSFDSVFPSVGDLVLIKDQTLPAENGVYVWNGTGNAMTRSADWDTAAKHSAGRAVFVRAGSNFSRVSWTLLNGITTLGVDAITFVSSGIDYAFLPATVIRPRVSAGAALGSQSFPFSEIHANGSSGYWLGDGSSVHRWSMGLLGGLSNGAPPWTGNKDGIFTNKLNNEFNIVSLNSNSSGVTSDISLRSGHQSTGASATGSINLVSGTQQGSGPSGNINLIIGTAGGVQGDIKFLKTGVPAAIGQVWTATATDGSGYWANTGSAWKKYTVSHAALQAAALSNDIELFSLPAGGVIHNAIIKHSASFTGGAIATYTLSVGIAGNLAKYASAFDVFQAPGGGVGQTSSVTDFEDTGAATSIRLAAVSTGDNLDQSATGSVDVWVLWGTLP